MRPLFGTGLLGGCMVLVAGLLVLSPAQEASTAAAAPATDGNAQQVLAERIDAALAAAWASQAILPAPPADDATWLRRLSLDLCGEIPHGDEVAAFLADRRPDKRARQIDQYLADRRFAAHLAGRWTKLLLCASGKNFARLTPYLRSWLEGAFARNASFDTVVRAILADTTESADAGSCSVILAYHDTLETLTSIAAKAFLGLQIQCAQCHDHPFDTWKQTDFNRFASFFTEVRGEYAVVEPDEMSVRPQRKPAGGKGTARRAKLEAEREEAMGRAAGHGQEPAGAAGEDVTSDVMDAAADPSGRKKSGGFRVFDMTPEHDLSDRLRRMRIVDISAARKKSADREAIRASMVAELFADPSIGERTDTATLVELVGLFGEAEAGTDPLADVARDPEQLAALLARLSPDARALVEKYRERRELFREAGFPDGTDYEPRQGVTRRAALARWIVGATNPWFGRSLVNRVWHQLLGKGLIEPVDDLSGGQDRVLPELLEELGREFVTHGTDVRFLFGAIARTRAYALASSTNPDAFAARQEERWFAAHPVRALTVEQMAGSLLRVGAAAAPRETLHKTLGMSCAAPDAVGETWWAASIPQSLLVMNGSTTDGALLRAQAADPRLTKFLDPSLSPVERLAPTWYATVGRPPDPTEAAAILEFAVANPGGLAAAFDDVTWALLNTTEFQTNH